MQLFYNKDLVADTKEIRFDKIESRHIVKVLRKKMAIRYTLPMVKVYFF